MISSVKRPNSNNKMLKSTSPAVIQTANPNENLYAVIINGCDWERYWNDISAMYCTLIEVYGYPEDNIFVHFVNGSSSFGDDFNADDVDDIDYNANKSTIERTFRNLSGEWTNDPNVPELGPDDQLFVFTDDHGGHDGSSYLCLPDYDLYPAELADYVEDINCASMIFVMEQCYSGGFESDITDVTDAACKHRVIHTACGEYESSWAEIWISDAKYDEFVFYWTAAARGYYPDPTGAEPWETSSATGSFQFSNYFVSHPSDYDPDTDSDGKVQMEEAFAYANNFDTWSPTGYYNLYPPYDDPENPITNNKTGFQEDLLDLSGLSGTISSTQTIDGDFVISDDLTVLSNVTLTISSGSKFYFYSGSDLVINGTLSAVGTSVNNITFDFTTPNQNGIKFYSGSSGSLSYCTIENAHYGVYCNGYLPTIQYCNINNNNYGIYLHNTGGQSNEIKYNVIEDNTYDGIYMYGSSAYKVYENTITDNGECGIYCTNNSAPRIWENTITGNGWAGVYCIINSPAYFGDQYRNPGYNLITGNDNQGVIAGYESDLIFGDGDEAGLNSIHDNTSYEVTAGYDSHLLAENNWWNRTSSPYYSAGDFNIDNNSSVDYIPALSYDPVGGLMKTASNPGGQPEGSSNNLFIDSELREALDMLLEGNYEEAITMYEKRFDGETDKSKRKYVLRRIAECYKLSEKKGFVDYLNNEVRHSTKGELSQYDELYAATLELENMFLIGERKYDVAIDNYIELKTNFTDNEVIDKPALFSLGYLYYTELGDNEKGKAYFAELATKYPDDYLTMRGKLITGEIDKIDMPGLPKEQLTEERISTEFALLGNYPNPFNPTTTIAYTLPDAGKVTVKIIDILGREVTILFDGYNTSGTHSVIWNAKDVASGIYFYSIVFNNQRLYKKMLLLK